MEVLASVPIITKYTCVVHSDIMLSCPGTVHLLATHRPSGSLCVYAGFDHGHLVFHICWSFSWIDGHELVLCCGGDTFGKQSPSLATSPLKLHT